MVTRWESDATLHASETSGFLAKPLGHLGQPFATPPTINSYEIVLQVTAGS